jgi:serine/threonine protein kinase
MSFCVSFYDKTERLNDIYDSHKTIDEIRLKTLRETSNQVGLKIDEIVSWFDYEKSKRLKLLAGANLLTTADEDLDTMFLTAPISFYEKTKFLDNIYASHNNINKVLLETLREISGEVNLKIDEIVSWFDYEKSKRSKLLATKNLNQHQYNFQLPLSPDRTMRYRGSNTLDMSMPQFPSISSDPVVQTDGVLSVAVSSEHHTVPLRAKRGRPAKSQPPTRSDSPNPDLKRQKMMEGISYLCPDCGTLFADKRWSEHVKRCHFPDQIWECQQLDRGTGKKCSKLVPRFSNFTKHLRAKHDYLSDEEISGLKNTSKLAVVNHFHRICGFSRCNHVPFQDRNTSIEHIKSHFKRLAEQPSPPEDMGVSQWVEKCGCTHELTRGVHYHVTRAKYGNNDDEDDDDGNDDDDDDGPRDDSSPNQPPDRSDFPPGDCEPPYEGDDGSFYEGNGNFDFPFYGQFSQYSAVLEQNTSSFDINAQQSTYTTYGLEQFVLPFTALRTLGAGGHGLVHEVIDQKSAKTFARKSVRRKGKEPAASLRLSHLRNELSALRKLSHPHLVKVIGAYADSENAHIILSPVADQNLASRLSHSIAQVQLVQWMESLASAISYLHTNSLQHLDIKPSNILLKGDHILLADFGTAKNFTGFTDDLEGDLAVTPTYCAPEAMLHHRQEYGSDLFSLGCVFSEMLTRCFAYSIEQFEGFRVKHGSKAFYLTIPAVKEWITLLPRCGKCVSPQQQSLRLIERRWKLRDTIFQMLEEEPSARPNASDLQFDFSDTFSCPGCGEERISNSSLALAESQPYGPATGPQSQGSAAHLPSDLNPNPSRKSGLECDGDSIFPVNVAEVFPSPCWTHQSLDALSSSNLGRSEPQKHDKVLSGSFISAHRIERGSLTRSKNRPLPEMSGGLESPSSPMQCAICALKLDDAQTLVDHADECTSSITSAEGQRPPFFAEGLLPEPDGSRSRPRGQVSSDPLAMQDSKAIVPLGSRATCDFGIEEDHQTKTKILECLRFHGMSTRHEQISAAHGKTFEWIFHDTDTQEKRSWYNFSEWLRKDAGIYWINGKAGSGKSTLMKFIVNHHKTSENLRYWSKQSPLTMASSFFWDSGMQIQRSIPGLLRTLLYTIMEDDLESMSTVFPDRWKRIKARDGGLGSWSIAELVDGLHLAILDSTKKFCFFIDGLDEYDGGSEELHLIFSLSTKANVKICVTSRPWVVFEQFFEGQPSLRLQDLTAGDIRLYVTETFNEEWIFSLLRQQKPLDAEKLVLDITDKASGVFLWVRLAVNSLLNGLLDGDDMANLRRRLDEVPPELEDLYWHMLNGINQRYKAQASRVFLLVQTASEPLSLLSLSLAEEGFEAAITQEVKPVPPDDISLRVENMRLRLNARCKGLLEVAQTPSPTVQYLHTTVKIFLESERVRSNIVSHSQFLDPDVTLSGAFLYGIKIMTPRLEMIDYFWDSLRKCLDYSFRFKNRNQDAYISVRKELERTGNILFETPGINGTPWIRNILSLNGRKQQLALDEVPHWTAT